MIVRTTPTARSYTARRGSHPLPCRDLREVGEVLADAKRLDQPFYAQANVMAGQRRPLTAREGQQVVAHAVAALTA